MAKTVSDLLTNIKRRAQLPDDGGTLSDADILAFASDELQNVVYPRLLALNEWHYAFTYSDSLNSAREIRINPRVSGNRIISVEYLDGSDYRYIPLRHPLMQKQADGESFSIYGNKIVFSEAVPTSGTLRIRAVLRPSKLVTSGATSMASDVSSGDAAFDVASGADLGSPTSIDIYYGNSPYEIAHMSRVVSIAGNTVTIGTPFGLALSVQNDLPRVCTAEQTDRVPLPDELHDYLAQRTAMRCMEARGFTKDLQNHMQKLGDLEKAFDRLTAPRVKGEFKAIVPEEWSWDGRRI